MLVQGNQRAQNTRGQTRRHDGGGGAVTAEDTCVDHVLCGALCTNLFLGLTESESLRLREEVSQEQFVNVLLAVLGRVDRVSECQEVRGNQAGTLVDQLVESVLAVGAGLAPEHFTGCVVDEGAVRTNGLTVGLHGQLLQVCGEAVQVLVVGQNRVGLSTQEVHVPNVQQTHQNGYVLSQGSGAEVLIHCVEACEEVSENLRAENDSQGGTDRGVYGVAAANPVPEAESVLGVNAECRNLVQCGGDSHEVLSHSLGCFLTFQGASLSQCGKQPLACHARVGEGFEGAEGLGCDDEQGGLGVQAGDLLSHIGRVNVGDEACGDACISVGLESLVHHDRAQVGATDTDVHNGLDALAGDAGPLAVAHALSECIDLLQHGVNVCVYVLAVNGQCGGVTLGAAQCGVQYCAVLGDVNVLAGEHRFASLFQLDLFSELEQQLNGFGGNQVLGKVDVQFVGGEAELLRAFRVSGKPFAQVRGEGFVMSGQSGPCGGGRGVNRSSHSSILLFSGAYVTSFWGDMERYGEKIETRHAIVGLAVSRCRVKSMTSSPEHTPADTHAPRYLLVSREGETLLNDDGTLHYLTGSDTAEPLTEEAILARSVIRPAAYGADAQKNTAEKNSGAQVLVLYCEDETLAQAAADLKNPRVRASASGFRYYPVHEDPEGRAHYATALARRDYLIDMRYSAYSGEEAPLASKGIRRTASGEMVFPRIEPAVMALVTSRDGERVLLANNRQWHPNRFALIAGFVDPGENLEEAIAREVYEETGLHALSTEYRMSDVWPFPRSLMICYRVRVDENEPIIHHDGEIRAARWFTAAELREAIAISEERGNSDEDDPAKLELPGTNAVARRMIDEWLAEKP